MESTAQSTSRPRTDKPKKNNKRAKNLARPVRLDLVMVKASPASITSVHRGHAAAVAYTLIESCRIAKVDIVNYLADVLVRVATHPASRVEDLLPDRWEKLVASERQAEPVVN